MSENPFQITFTLKQHTPIIHFQHEQAGATLRATELKPKLDDWLRTKLKGIDAKLYDDKHALIESLPVRTNQRNPSSPYQVAIHWRGLKKPRKYIIGSYVPKFIRSNPSSKDYDILDRAPYFANNEQIKKEMFEDLRQGMMIDPVDELVVVFRFMNQEWKDLLKAVFPLFLSSTNFGTRQGKGFGSYTVAEVDTEQFEKHLKDAYKLVFKSPECRDMEHLFQVIEQVYKSLKSGPPGGESELRNYFNQKMPPIEWEKPAIQKVVGEIAHRELRVQQRAKDVKFVRALLGLAEIYEYPHFDGIKAQVKHPLIARYASPILFKVYGMRAYLISNLKEQIPDRIPILIEEAKQKALAKKEPWSKADEDKLKMFSFHFSHRSRGYGNKLELEVPNGFDLKDFLAWAMPRQKGWVKI